MPISIVKPAECIAENLPVISDACNAYSSNVISIKCSGHGKKEKVRLEEKDEGFSLAIASPPTLQKASASSEFLPAVKASKMLDQHLQEPAYAGKYAACLERALSLSLTELQKLYPAEYNSIRSRKQQAKARHIKFDDRLKDFRDWLIHIGPRPAEGWTVDRKNNHKGYVPGNISWQPKLRQTQNRKVTKWHKADGKLLTTKQLAAHLELSYNCVYKRLQSGWSIDRLLASHQKVSGIKSWQFPADLAHILEPKYRNRKAFLQTRLNWYIEYLNNVYLKNILTAEEQAFISERIDLAEKELDEFLRQEWKEAKEERDELFAAMSGSSDFGKPLPLTEEEKKTNYEKYDGQL